MQLDITSNWSMMARTTGNPVDLIVRAGSSSERDRTTSKQARISSGERLKKPSQRWCFTEASKVAGDGSSGGPSR